MVTFGPLSAYVTIFCHFAFREDKVGDIRVLKLILPPQGHSKAAPACLGQPHFKSALLMGFTPNSSSS